MAIKTSIPGSLDDIASRIAWPVRIEKISRAYDISDERAEHGAWEAAPTVATCSTMRGLIRRYREERGRVEHDGGRSWSGSIRIIDASEQVVDQDLLYWAIRDAMAARRS